MQNSLPAARSKTARMRAAVLAAFPHTLPVLMGFACLGLTYGVLMASKGYGPLWSLLMSAIAFGGSMQYVAGVALALNEKSLKICMEGRFTSAEGDYLASLLSGGYPEGLAPYMRLIFLVAANHWLKDENRMSPEAFARFIWALAGAARGLKGGAKH